ncbi:hypothetical protein HY639_01755 [Candidatus Woesearchaeota archaeon]|nr:hypothetical protein [Candidatus Woesearchaeota archaeon]
MEWQDRCFSWMYLHTIYLAAPSRRRRLEEELMRLEKDYGEGDRQLSLCELCKPVIPCLFVDKHTIGFSDKQYYFASFEVRLTNIPVILEKAYQRLADNIRTVAPHELVSVRNAEAMLPLNKFDRGIMVCQECKATPLEPFLFSYVKKAVFNLSPNLSITRKDVSIVPIRTIPHYSPQMYQ